MSIKLLKDLDFAGIVASTSAVTESGREFVKNYAGYLFSNEANYRIVNKFCAEARQFSFDSGVMEGLSKVASFISGHKTSWALASVCENLATSRPAYDALSKNAVSQVSKLLESLDENQINQYIKAGALKNIQYIPEFRNICKSVYSEAVCEVKAPTFNLTAPVSYVEESEGSVYFQVAGRNFKVADSVYECDAPSTKFTRINENLKYVTKTEAGLSYTWAPRSLSFVIAESLSVTDKNGKVTVFTEAKDFNEFRDTFSRGLFGVQQKTEFMNVTESLKEIWENWSNVVECDCGRILTTSNRVSLAIVEGKDNVIVNVISGAAPSFKSHDNIMEALKDVERISGVNLQAVFEDRISEETAKVTEAEEAEARKVLLEAKIDERRKRIEMLTEQYKNDPYKLAVLNKLAKEVSKL